MNNGGRFPTIGLLLLAAAGSVQAEGMALDVAFKGTLLEPPCSFEQNDGALEVAFPVRALKYFDHYDRTETTFFAIGLKNCTAATQGKLVEMTFTFPEQDTTHGTPMLKPAGDTGLLIGLVDAQGNPITPDHAVDIGTITHTGDGASNRFTLGAWVMAPAGVKISTGQYRATTTFTIAYR